MSQTHHPTFSFFAVCAPQIEALLAEEIRGMRGRGVREQRGGVIFTGTKKDAYRVCLFSRLASRVLLFLEDVPAKDRDTLYASIKAMPWDEHLKSTGSLKIQTTGVNANLKNTQFTNMLVKDAIADRFNEKYGHRPSVRLENPDLNINVLIRGESARVSIDLSGEPLHKRGYRTEGTQVAAPLKESIAAAMLYIADWPTIAKRGGSFVDFMCGSGTIAIEAALMACDIAPHLNRQHWGFTKWLGHDEEAWERVLDEAKKRAEEGRKTAPRIVASDRDANSIEIARRSIRRLQLDNIIDLKIAEIGRMHEKGEAQPESESTGLIALNPPYGERLATSDELVELYRKVAAYARDRYQGFDLAIISPDLRVNYGLQQEPKLVRKLYNGRILTQVSVFEIGEAQEIAAPDEKNIYLSDSASSDFAGKGAKEIRVKHDIDASAFTNRLTKMYAHIGKWARRAGVTCYRVYDADLPEFNVAIDIYEGKGASENERWLHIAEYAAPDEVLATKARARLDAVLEQASEVLDIPRERIVVKERKVMRGLEQYEQSKQGPTPLIITENELEFELDLSSYLDTGIFLDHRDVRKTLRDMSAGKTCLNLFSYTGTASVYLAAGGAKSVTSVDLSRTYTLWAGRNMKRNNLFGPYTTFVEADVLAWLEKAQKSGEKYDLIFCDPPSFSNSKSMERSWDVYRDHPEMLRALAQLLDAEGTILFSTNKRGFKLNAAALEDIGLESRDMTAATMPKDFEKNSGIHKAFRLFKKN